MSQYIAQAEVTLNYLSSDELRDLLNDDDKLEARVNELVRLYTVSLVVNDSYHSYLFIIAYSSSLHWKMIKR